MSKTRWFFLLLLLAALGATGWHFARQPANGAAAATEPTSAIPVSLATVEARDVPVWLSGIGAVEAFNTVTVRPRVSGTLDKVNFTEGQMVRAGEALAQIDPRPYRSVLEQARARKAQDDALLVNARRELERIRELVESDAESQRILDQQEATVAQLAAAVQADQAALDSAQLDFDFTTVRAPIAGRTGIRRVDAGNVVTANQDAGLVVVTQLQPISVLFTLPQHHFAALRPHMRSDAPPLLVQAIDATSGVVLGEGKLDLVDNQIDTASGTLRLKASFPNEDTALWPGQYVTARVLVRTLAGVPVVPAEVVQAGLDGPFAYLLREGGTVEARSLELGPRSNGIIVIERGLAVGDRTVREGHSKLKPGVQVVAVPDGEGK